MIPSRTEKKLALDIDKNGKVDSKEMEQIVTVGSDEDKFV